MYYEKVILSISAMLFVEHLYAQPGPSSWTNSSLVGQTGTSQMHKFIKLERTEFKIKQTINNDAFVYQGVNQGKLSYLVTILRLKTHGRRRSKGMTTVRTFLKTTGTIKQQNKLV
jgi:hypothetical protein